MNKKQEMVSKHISVSFFNKEQEIVIKCDYVFLDWKREKKHETRNVLPNEP